MKPYILAVLVSTPGLAAPFVVTDPVDSRATHCAFTMDAGVRKDVPVTAHGSEKICKLDVAMFQVGKHTVTVKVLNVDDSAGLQESQASTSFAFGEDVVLMPMAAPKGLQLHE